MNVKKQAVNVPLFIIALSGAIYCLAYPLCQAQREYICGDPKISYKYQKNTISTKFIIIYQQIIAFQMFWLLEFLLSNIEGLKNKFKSSGLKAINWFFNYIFVFSIMIIVCSFIKGLCGGNRPHFLDVCKPDNEDCTLGTLVTDFTCTNPNLTPKTLLIISRSFPSGHAGLAAYFAVHMIWFLQRRFRQMNATFLIPAIQGALLGYMLFCGVSRIADHAHHSVDVLFGLLFGSLFAVFNCLCLSDNFKLDDEKIDSHDNGTQMKEIQPQSD